MPLFLVARRLAALLSLTLAACASAPPPHYATDHPANPAAAVSPPSPESQTLKSYRSAAPGTRTPANPATSDVGEDHAGHQMPQESGREQQ